MVGRDYEVVTFTHRPTWGKVAYPGRPLGGGPRSPPPRQRARTRGPHRQERLTTRCPESSGGEHPLGLALTEGPGAAPSGGMSCLETIGNPRGRGVTLGCSVSVLLYFPRRNRPVGTWETHTARSNGRWSSATNWISLWWPVAAGQGRPLAKGADLLVMGLSMLVSARPGGGDHAGEMA